MRKISAVFLALALCLTTGGLVAYAAGNDSGPVTEVELHPGEAAAVASFEFNSATEDGVYTYVTDTVEEAGIDTRAVSISEDFTVAVGNSWSRSFDTWKLFVENHNAFKTIISDVSGTYKLLITDDQGYEYSSGEYSTGKTFNTTNASADRTFTVYILNTGTSKLTGHVKISSYYNEASDNAGVPNADTLSATPDGSTGANKVNNGDEPQNTLSATPDGSTGANEVNNGDEPQIAVSIPVDVDSAPLDELGRATLYWNDTTINYDTRMRFISDYAGGYFDLDGVTATFTVEITNGNSENIQIDWCNEDGDVTVLYTGKTDSATVSYTSSGREKGNFRVWNKAVAAITVDASITY